jgi:hypothetical protein
MLMVVDSRLEWFVREYLLHWKESFVWFFFEHTHILCILIIAQLLITKLQHFNVSCEVFISRWRCSGWVGLLRLITNNNKQQTTTTYINSNNIIIHQHSLHPPIHLCQLSAVCNIKVDSYFIIATQYLNHKWIINKWITTPVPVCHNRVCMSPCQWDEFLWDSIINK